MAKKSTDKTKRMILVALGGLFLFILFYQFFINTGTKPASKPATTTTRTTTAPQQNVPIQNPQRVPTAAEQPDQIALQLTDMTPLNLALLNQRAGSAQVSARGNIFNYYVPPPPPPVPPPPPPPIALQMVQPSSAVAGTPRAFTMTIRGQGFPADAQIIIDGRARQTQRGNDNSLSTQIEPHDYASARNLNIEVKSQSDPAKMYSNPLQFVVQPAPEPPFKYVGRLGEHGLFEMLGDKRVERLTRGSTIQGVWRIDAITDARVEVTHTQHGIKKIVQMADKGRQ